MLRIIVWRRIKIYLSELSAYMNCSDKKPIHVQLRDIGRLFHYYKKLPYHYFRHSLYRRSITRDIINYLPSTFLNSFRKRANPLDQVDLVENKYRFANLLKSRNIRTVDDIFLIRPNLTLVEASTGQIRDFDEFIALLNREKISDIFIKPISASQGWGALKLQLEPDSLRMGKEGISRKRLAALLEPRKIYVVQRAIDQHDVINAIYPDSVNTVRLDTLVDEGEVLLNGAILRTGANGSCVDNWSAGGFIIGIDIDSGKLGRYGIRDTKYGKQHLEIHPDSGTRFLGIKIPMWCNVKKLVHSAALCAMPLRSLGWDVAISKNGPIIIEANDRQDLFMLQEGIGGLRNTPVGNEILRINHFLP